jgi:hypothetical protein
MPNGRCKLHGGKSLSGPASGTFKTGRYSKVLPARLLEGYLDARSDPELLSLKDEVAVVSSRIIELAGRLDGTDTPALWLELREALAQHEKGTPGAMDTIRNLIARGATDAERWGALNDAFQDKLRLVRAEWKRCQDLQVTMTAENVTVLVMALLDAVIRHVSDAKTRHLIAQEFAKLTGSEPTRGPIGT